MPRFADLFPAKDSITKIEYQDYLRRWFPQNHLYVFYSGGAVEQAQAFVEANPQYNYYVTMLSAPKDKDPDPAKWHPWDRQWDRTAREDDAETASSAMATVASGDVLVFGAVEYQQEETWLEPFQSFFFKYEIKELRQGLIDVRVKNILHMAKGAIEKSQVAASEDAHKKITWRDGYEEGYKNRTRPPPPQYR